jgi:predicted TIM-barrel fold metal-dependent hydrolase
VSDTDYQYVDADNHFYEAPDAFFRHGNERVKRFVQWVDQGKKKFLLFGGAHAPGNANPTFNPVAKPGVLAEYYKGKNTSGVSPKDIMELEPIRPEYRNRDARIAVMDEQGVQSLLMLPTLALGVEEILNENPPALHAAFQSFNQWLDEDWGFARDDRIISPPLITLVDVEQAEKDLQSLIDRGTKAICLRPAAVMGPFGTRSPADPVYDRFWSMVEEASLLVVFHSADSGYSRFASHWGEKTHFQGYKDAPFAEILSLHLERPIFDTMAALISHGLFERHPSLRIAVVELGSGWVRELIRRMEIAYGKIPRAFAKDPSDVFREHVSVAPFHEDHVGELVQLIGADRVLLGSDWPHPEGVTTPAAFLDEIADLPTEVQKKIMSDNLRTLLQLPVAAR